MSIRITGLASNMDTDSMVEELVKASSSKKQTLEKEQTKLGWTQTAWSTLNTKIYSFFNKSLDNMKYEGNYKKKKTTVADSSIATIVAGDSAVNGTQTLAVTQLAKSGYLTGGKLSGCTTGTTMADLGAVAEGDTAAVSVNGTTITLTAGTTIGNLVSQMNKAGVTASFDETNQRFFISASKSGEEGDFSLTANDANGLSALQSMKLLTSADASNNSEYQEWANMSEVTLGTRVADESARRATAFYNAVQSLTDTNIEIDEEIHGIEAERDGYAITDAYVNAMAAVNPLDTAANNATALSARITATETKMNRYEALMTKQADEGLTAEETTELTDLEAEHSSWDVETDKAHLQALNKYVSYDTSIRNLQTTQATNQTTIDDYSRYYTTSLDGDGNVTANATTTMTDVVELEYRNKIAASQAAITAAEGITDSTTGAVRVIGTDAKIILNGAEFTSSSNNFAVNGLTITAQSVSDSTTSTKYYDADGNEVAEGTPGATAVTSTDYKTTAVNTTDDTDGIYKMIKDFFTEYNKLINEMDSLYNATSAKGYEPLTSDEKEAMTDNEVEAWEKKIKDALLRKDSTLGTTISNLKMNMMNSFEINGTKISLATYGIETASYFTSAENEHGAYHIDGDPDDTISSTEKDKLKSAIASDPTKVASFFSKLASSIYDKLNKQMSSNEYSSIYKVYDDKKMSTEYSDYTKKIAEQQKKLTALEDRYYSQFTAMEVAMTKLNSQQSSMSSLFS